MKLFVPLSVLVLLGLFTPKLFADPVLTINAGVAGGAVVETDIAGVEQWIYNNDQLIALDDGLLSVYTDTLTATLTDTAGIYALNVTDVCADAAVLAANTPCAGFAFSDTALGIPDVLSATGNLALAADVNVGAAGVDLAGVSIGGGSEDIGFNNPPPSVTPEPPALTLLGTGLLGLAGVVKKRLFA